MRSIFARMFLLLAFSVATGCTYSHYDGDSLDQYRTVGGFVRSSATGVRVQMKNFLTGNWENVPAYATPQDTDPLATPDTDISFWFSSYKLYHWSYKLPQTVAAKYRSGNWVELRFWQGETLLMSFERTEHSEDLNSNSPYSCILADYGLNYDEGTDWYIDSAGDHRLLRQQPFLDCGLQTATGSDGVLRLQLP